MGIIKAIKNWQAWHRINTEEDIYTMSESAMDNIELAGSIDADTALKLVKGDPETIRKWQEKHPAQTKSKSKERTEDTV